MFVVFISLCFFQPFLLFYPCGFLIIPERLKDLRVERGLTLELEQLAEATELFKCFFGWLTSFTQSPQNECAHNS